MRTQVRVILDIDYDEDTEAFEDLSARLQESIAGAVGRGLLLAKEGEMLAWTARVERLPDEGFPPENRSFCCDRMPCPKCGSRRSAFKLESHDDLVKCTMCEQWFDLCSGRRVEIAL